MTYPAHQTPEEFENRVGKIFAMIQTSGPSWNQNFRLELERFGLMLVDSSASSKLDDRYPGGFPPYCAPRSDASSKDPWPRESLIVWSDQPQLPMSGRVMRLIGSCLNRDPFYGYISKWRWFRRAVGGRWEKWRIGALDHGGYAPIGPQWFRVPEVRNQAGWPFVRTEGPIEVEHYEASS